MFALPKIGESPLIVFLPPGRTSSGRPFLSTGIACLQVVSTRNRHCEPRATFSHLSANANRGFAQHVNINGLLRNADNQHMRLQFVFRNAKYSLCTVAFCLVFGTGQSNAQTLSGHDSVFLSVEDAGKTKVFSASRPSDPQERYQPLSEQTPQSTDVQTSESLPITPPLFLPDCPHGVEPQPFSLDINGLRVLVDFIVNTQGRIESPLILRSSGQANAKLVIDIIQRWRFRPATCNGVPTEVEIRMLFVGPRKRLPHPTASVGPGT
jgi:TonB family protein